MEVLNGSKTEHVICRNIALKESMAMVLAFFALQFSVLAIGQGADNSVASRAWLSLISSAVAAMGVVILGRLVAGDRFAESGPDGVGVSRISLSSASVCLLSGALLGSVIVGLTGVYDHVGPTDPLMAGAYLEGSTGMLVAWVASLLVIAPICEEMICRGFILPALTRKVGVGPAVVLTALIFLLVHLPQIGGYWVAATGIFSLGLIAGVMRVRSGSLFGSIAAHAGYNAMPLAYLLWAQFTA